MTGRTREAGAAVLVVLLATTVMLALGTALMVASISEIGIAASFRATREAGYAADAGLDLAIDDLETKPDWNVVLDGTVRSAFTDGPPAGPKSAMAGIPVDLTTLVGMANCRQLRPCTAAEMDTSMPGRPWGVNNPRWVPYLYGPLRGVTTGIARSCCYLVVLVADDPAENDDDPRHDGADALNPGSGVLLVRAEAFGPRSARAIREAAIARSGGEVRRLAWRIGQSP